MVSSLAAIALAALPAVPPMPATWDGPSFSCRMTHSSGGAFVVSGAFGTGRRFAIDHGDGRSDWGYTFAEATVADSEIQFSGRAIEARTSRIDVPSAADRFEFRIAYPRTGGGTELIIRRGGSGRHPARLVGYRHPDLIAQGACTLGHGAENRP